MNSLLYEETLKFVDGHAERIFRPFLQLAQGHIEDPNTDFPIERFKSEYTLFLNRYCDEVCVSTARYIRENTVDPTMIKSSIAEIEQVIQQEVFRKYSYSVQQQVSNLAEIKNEANNADLIKGALAGAVVGKVITGKSTGATAGALIGVVNASSNAASNATDKKAEIWEKSFKDQFEKMAESILRLYDFTMSKIAGNEVDVRIISDFDKKYSERIKEKKKICDEILWEVATFREKRESSKDFDTFRAFGGIIVDTIGLVLIMWGYFAFIKVIGLYGNFLALLLALLPIGFYLYRLISRLTKRMKIKFNRGNCGVKPSARLADLAKRYN